MKCTSRWLGSNDPDNIAPFYDLLIAIIELARKDAQKPKRCGSKTAVAFWRNDALEFCRYLADESSAILRQE